MKKIEIFFINWVPSVRWVAATTRVNRDGGNNELHYRSIISGIMKKKPIKNHVSCTNCTLLLARVEGILSRFLTHLRTIFFKYPLLDRPNRRILCIATYLGILKAPTISRKLTAAQIRTFISRETWWITKWLFRRYRVIHKINQSVSFEPALLAMLCSEGVVRWRWQRVGRLVGRLVGAASQRGYSPPMGQVVQLVPAPEKKFSQMIS